MRDEDRPAVKIVYQTRFSYFGQSGWQSRASADPALLFDADRLGFRMQLYEDVTLASLAAQTDRDFHVAVLSSSLMPEVWRKRLTALVGDVLGDRGTVLFKPPGRAANMMRRHVRRSFAAAPHVAQVVLDDDDALCVDFTAICRHEATHAVDCPYEPASVCFLSFPRGLTLGYADGRPAWLAPRMQPFTNLGLTLVAPPAHRRTVLGVAHRKVGQR